MSLVLRRTYLKAKSNVLLSSGNGNKSLPCIFTFLTRTISDDNYKNDPVFSNSTILMENGFNVQELPVVVRKLEDLSQIDKPLDEPAKTTPDSTNYNLIQAEFKQCIDLRDVFSLLSKCTKITPNIALGAMERIYDLEKDPAALKLDTKSFHINVAKGAILDKLLKVVMKTEDTQTILNILKTVSSFMEPYKYKFCNELLFRVIDNKLSVEQLCEFTAFLIKNKADCSYSETIDKLWVGFIEKEKDINETNIVEIFKILPGLRASKRIILTILEQKLSDLWYKIDSPVMQEILNIFILEKYFSLQSYTIVGHWLYTNIHILDEDSLLDIIIKFTRLKYTDDQVERAVEKYIRLKGSKIHSQILIMGVLNYCMQFQIRNEHILNVCSEYFVTNGKTIPCSFLKSFIYPYGYLYFNPENLDFWNYIEDLLYKRFNKISTNDLCSIILSCIYIGKYPMKLVSKLFSAEYLAKISNSETSRKLHLIDTALSIELKNYAGPYMPKDQWSESISHDARVRNIINKVKSSFVAVAGGDDKLSTAVLVPHLHSDETYLIDVMLHAPGLGSNIFNWKLKLVRNKNIAILIHLPDHFCSDNEQLVGPQIMRKKHLRLLGFKVVSLKYAVLSEFYTSHNKSGLKKYLMENIKNAEPCL